MGLRDGGTAGKSPPQAHLQSDFSGFGPDKRLWCPQRCSQATLRWAWQGFLRGGFRLHGPAWKASKDDEGRHRQERGESRFPFCWDNVPEPSLLPQKHPPLQVPCSSSLQPSASPPPLLWANLLSAQLAPRLLLSKFYKRSTRHGCITFHLFRHSMLLQKWWGMHFLQCILFWGWAFLLNRQLYLLRAHLLFVSCKVNVWICISTTLVTNCVQDALLA